MVDRLLARTVESRKSKQGRAVFALPSADSNRTILHHEVFMRFARPKTHENAHFRSSACSSGLGAARLRFGNSLLDGDAVPSRRSDYPPKLRTEFSEEITKGIWIKPSFKGFSLFVFFVIFMVKSS